MSDPSTDDPLQPTLAYEQAKGSPIYRLSELMFGSLLAAYVLGFIGTAATDLGRSHTDIGMAIRGFNLTGGSSLIVLECASVSVAFAYLTASWYLSYHAGILTMFHVPFTRLRWDFAASLMQAVSFGLSSLFPEAFPFLLGLTLVFGARRQQREHDKLVDELWKLNPAGKHPRPEGPPPAFRTKVRTWLDSEEYKELEGWKPPSFTLKTASRVFVGLGAGLLGWAEAQRITAHFHSDLNSRFWPGLVPIIVASIAILVVHYAHTNIFPARAQFFRELDKLESDMVKAPDASTVPSSSEKEQRPKRAIDAQFDVLIARVKAYPNDPPRR